MCVEGLYDRSTDSVCQWGYMIDAKRKHNKKLEKWENDNEGENA